MKKSLTLFFILFFSSTFPSFALSWSDIFPAISVDKSSRQVPGTAKSQEVKTEDSFSNTLKDNRAECSWQDWFSRDWQAKYNWTRVGTSPEGDPVYDNVIAPYPAENVTTNDDYSQMANNYPRVYQYFTSYGGIKCTYDPKDFTSMNASGKNSVLKGQDTLTLKRLRSQLLVNAVRSLDQKDPKDVAEQDIHELWVCPSGCKEIGSSDTGDCRPVTISELVYAAIKQGGISYPNRFNVKTGANGVTEKIYYTDSATEGSDFPGNVVSTVANYYESKGKDTYYSKFKKDFSLQSPDFYRNFYEQLNAFPKGNINTKITNVGYNDIFYTQPAPTPYDRTIPAGVGAAAAQGSSLNKFMPANHKDLPKSDNPCDGPVTGSKGVVDKPSPVNIFRFVLGVFGTVLEGGFHKEVYNNVGVTYPATIVGNAKDFEDLSAYLVPKTIQDKTKLVNEPFGSKVAAGYPVDYGTRGSKFYTEAANPLLLPKSWQVQVRTQTGTAGGTDGGNTGTPDPTLKSFCPAVLKAAAATGLDPGIILADISVESGGNPNAISNQGAVGLMQVMPSDGIAASLFPGLFADRPTTQQLLDPDFNIQYATTYMASLVKYWGSIRDALMHYGPMGIGYQYADMVIGRSSSYANLCSGGNNINL